MPLYVITVCFQCWQVQGAIKRGSAQKKAIANYLQWAGQTYIRQRRIVQVWRQLQRACTCLLMGPALRPCSSCQSKAAMPSGVHGQSPEEAVSICFQLCRVFRLTLLGRPGHSRSWSEPTWHAASCTPSSGLLRNLSMPRSAQILASKRGLYLVEAPLQPASTTFLRQLACLGSSNSCCLLFFPVFVVNHFMNLFLVFRAFRQG